MPQSSLMTWLKKPAAVKQTPAIAPDEGKPSVLPSSTPSDSMVSSGNGHTQAPTSDLAIASQPTVIGSAFSLRPLVSNVEMVPLSEELIPSFKRLNALLLPIAYPQSFYAETMTEPHHSITLMALWHPAPSNTGLATTTVEKPRLIGAIRCRILPSANLYISTIGVLSPYRSYGIALHLLNKIIVKASREHGVKCITAHVWEANEDGLEWYKKRGFEIVGKEHGYYRKLKPSGAILVRKWIGVGDLLGNPVTPNDSFN